MTTELKLTSKNDTEDRILDYLLENVSPALAEKINTGTKTLQGALRYCRDQARKLAQSDMVCVEDATVFGWVIHYFEEADLDEEEKPKAEPKVQVPAGVKVNLKPARAEHGHQPARRPRKTLPPDAVPEVPSPVETPSTAELEASPARSRRVKAPKPVVEAKPVAAAAPVVPDPQMNLFAALLEEKKG